MNFPKTGPKVWVTALMACLLHSAAWSQAYPNKPVTMNVGFAAGGSTDIASRVFAQQLSAKLGQPVVIQSRPGAAGMIAADIVMKAPPDGYQLLMLASGTFTNATLGNKPLDLSPISFAGSIPFVLVVGPNQPAKTLKEFIELAKSQPGKLSFASDGIGGASHLAGEMFNKLAAVNTAHVPYKGGAEGVFATASGQVDMDITTVTSALPMIQSGKLRALAVSGRKRSAFLPSVPTFEEGGLKGFELDAFISLMGPPGMPKPIVDRLNAAMVEIANDAEVKPQFAKIAMEPQASTPAQLADYLSNLKTTLSRLGRESNIKLE